ncbi:MAG: GSCFA domain-containing protein [Bacteroidales bacterium]|nr:GSCFA domain-containing protein [Bacteroidales bacterium]
MDNYFTPVALPRYSRRITCNERLLLLGSCFAENIGAKFSRLQFDVDINPFGVLFNPASVAACLRRLLSGRFYEASELFEYQGVWHSFAHHSRFSAGTPEQALQLINERFEQSCKSLREATVLFITFGTAYVWELKTTGTVVSNCHKLPDASFRRFRLTPNEIIDDYRQLLTALWEVNPALYVLFTVSPVRHLNDGAIGNQLSKSILLLAIDRLVNGFGTDRCNYFPAYEIMLDELRDYRFYAPDMLHPAPVAINHIWNRLTEAMMSADTRAQLREREKAAARAEHRSIIGTSGGPA